MEIAIENVIAEYDKRAAEELKLLHTMSVEEQAIHPNEKYMNFMIPIGRAAGMFMNLLVKEAKSRAVLEVGTSFGYSTLWLAEAARETGGKVITLELHPEKQEAARAAIEKAGLAGQVDFRLGDARETISNLEGPFDFVLLDLWKDLYIPCFDLFYPKLASGAFVAADNIILPPSNHAMAERYCRHIRTKKYMESILLPIGNGIELSRYIGS